MDYVNIFSVVFLFFYHFYCNTIHCSLFLLKIHTDYVKLYKKQILSRKADVFMKVGLVLEGGAMRGMFTAGVLDIFLDNDIHVDGIIGVSAGALFGVNFPSRQRGRALRYNKNYAGDKRYISIHSLIRTGDIVSKDFAYGTLPCTLDPFDDETFINSGIDYYAVVTNIETGKAEYVKITKGFEQMETLRASGSMPFVSRPVIIDGNKYLDGAVSDSIPYKKFIEMGYDKIIVVLTRDINYRKGKMNALAIDLMYRKYPKLKELLKNRHNMYNESIDDLKTLEDAGKVFVIRPSEPINIGKIEKDKEKLQAVYDLGIKDAMARIYDLKKYISG